MEMNYSKRYKDAQERGGSAEIRLAARTLSPENEILAKRYDDIPEDYFLTLELKEFRSSQKGTVT